MKNLVDVIFVGLLSIVVFAGVKAMHNNNHKDMETELYMRSYIKFLAHGECDAVEGVGGKSCTWYQFKILSNRDFEQDIFGLVEIPLSIRRKFKQ